MAYKSKEVKKSWEKRYNSVRQQRRLSDPRTELVKQAKARAKRSGVPFTLSKEDIIVPELCPILGIKLEHGNGRACAGSPSLDRVIPDRGYVKDNVWVISFRANQIKNDSTLEELELITAAVRQRLMDSKGGDL
jgi:hypothetical protein